MSGGQEKIFSILGPKLSESKAQQYYRDKLLQIRVEVTDYEVNPDCFDDTDAGLITLQAIFSDWEFANIVDNLVFTLHYSLESFFNQIDNFWAVKPMLTLIK